MAEHLQTLAQVLQAAEGHITDRDMSPDPLWGPVINGPDLEIMLVGAEAGFDFPQLVISGDNIQNVQIVCTMDQNSMKVIPLGCVLDQSLVNRNVCGATFLVNMRDTEPRKEDDGFDGAFLSP